MKQDESPLRDVAKPLRAGKEVVMAAVRHWGGALEYADEPLRKDKEVVLAAVRQNGLVCPRCRSLKPTRR